jgi:hypothetical protein
VQHIKEEYDHYNCEPNVVAELAHLLHHQEAQILFLNWRLDILIDIFCSIPNFFKKILRWYLMGEHTIFYLVSQKELPKMKTKISHNHFLPHPSKLIIHNHFTMQLRKGL